MGCYPTTRPCFFHVEPQGWGGGVAAGAGDGDGGEGPRGHTREGIFVKRRIVLVDGQRG